LFINHSAKLLVRIVKKAMYSSVIDSTLAEQKMGGAFFKEETPSP